MTLPLPGWHMGMDRICDKARGTCPIQAGQGRIFPAILVL